MMEMLEMEKNIDGMEEMQVDGLIKMKEIVLKDDDKDRMDSYQLLEYYKQKLDEKEQLISVQNKLLRKYARQDIY